MGIKNFQKNNKTQVAHFRYLSSLPICFMDMFRSGVIPSFNAVVSPYYLSDFRPTYPDFQPWLNKKVLPEVSSNSYQRDVIFTLTRDQKSTVGFAIVKNTFEEKKICSFYILPAYQHLGYGSALMEECFDYLGTELPLITMPERCKELFEGLLNKYKFSFKHELADYYSDGNMEYVFNGILKR